MRNRIYDYSLLIAIGVCLFFLNLGGASLWDVDEGRNSTCAHEMMAAGEWITPTFNAQLRPHKPVLFYWLQISAYHIFGVNEFGARFPSALAALFSVLLAYELARRMFDTNIGLMTGVILACTPMLMGAARFANQDALLTCCTLATMYCLWRWFENNGAWWAVASGAACGLAVLAKGPIGMFIPGATLLGFLVWQRDLSRLRTLNLLWGFLVLCCVALPWYVMVAIETNANFLHSFFFTHNVDRFLNPMESHSGPVWYYPAVLLVGFAPWSVFLAWTGWYGVRSAKTEGTHRILLLWIGVVLLFFTFAATKLPNYILPMVPPLAMLTAVCLERWRRGELQIPSWAMAVSFVFLALMGVTASVGLLTVGGAFDISSLRFRPLPELKPWAAIGVIPFLGAIVGWWLWKHGRNTGVLRTLSATAVLFLLPIAVWINALFNEQKPTAPLVAQAQALQPYRDIRIGGWQVAHLPSLNFYTQREVIHHQSRRDAIAFLKSGLPVYLFVLETEWREIAPSVRTAHEVVGAHFDLYRNNRIVVVINRAQHASR